jgi:hypothetical protein
MTKITIQIEDGIRTDDALKLLLDWYYSNEQDPKKWPMTGVISNDLMHMEKRDYRKTDCFRVVKRTEAK